MREFPRVRFELTAPPPTALLKFLDRGAPPPSLSWPYAGTSMHPSRVLERLCRRRLRGVRAPSLLDRRVYHETTGPTQPIESASNYEAAALTS